MFKSVLWQALAGTEPGAAALEWGDYRAGRGVKGCGIARQACSVLLLYQVSIAETAVGWWVIKPPTHPSVTTDLPHLLYE